MENIGQKKKPYEKKSRQKWQRKMHLKNVLNKKDAERYFKCFQFSLYLQKKFKLKIIKNY